MKFLFFLLLQRAIVPIGSGFFDGREQKIYWQVVGPTGSRPLLQGEKVYYDIRFMAQSNGKYDHMFYLRHIDMPVRSMPLQWASRKAPRQYLSSIYFADSSGRAWMIYYTTAWKAEPIKQEFYDYVLGLYVNPNRE